MEKKIQADDDKQREERRHMNIKENTDINCIKKTVWSCKINNINKNMIVRKERKEDKGTEGNMDI